MHSGAESQISFPSTEKDAEYYAIWEWATNETYLNYGDKSASSPAIPSSTVQVRPQTSVSGFADQGEPVTLPNQCLPPSSDGLWHDSDSVSQPQTQYDPWGQTVFPLLQPMPSVYVTTPGQNGHAMHASDWDVLDKSTRDLLSRRGVHFKPPEIASSLLFPNHIPHQSSPSATTRPSASLLSYDAQSPNHPDPPLTAILPAPLLYTPVQSSAPTPSTQWQEATTCSGLTPSPNPMSLMPNSPLSNTSSIAGTPSLVESWSPSSDGGPRTPAGTLYCCKFCKRPYDRFKTWRATSKTNTRGWRPDCSLMDNCGGRTR